MKSFVVLMALGIVVWFILANVAAAHVAVTLRGMLP